MTNLLWFSEISSEDREACGNKAVSLAELYNIGIPIPQGFVITNDVYQKFLEENKIHKQIDNVLGNLNLNDSKLMQMKSDEINDIILRAEFPDNIKEEILENYENLDVNNEILKFGNKNALNLIKMGRSLPYVAIRSSSTNALENPTYLNVKGNNALLLSLKKSWSSLFALKSVYFREKNNLLHNKICSSIITQRMINPESSGIISIIPNENDIKMNAVYGFPELIMNKSVNYNTYIIDKEDLIIKHKNTPRQEYMVTREEMLSKNIKRQIPENRNYQILTDEQILQLADYGRKIERYYQKPLNIEFAVESGKIYIINAKDLNIN